MLEAKNEFRSFKFSSKDIKCYFDADTGIWHFLVNSYKKSVSEEKRLEFTQEHAQIIMSFLEELKDELG